LRWTSIKTAFNVVFKEFITHIRNETSDKDLKAAIKQKVQEIRDEGDVYTEFVAADVTIVERKLEDIEKTLSDEDAINRMKSILSLLDVFKKLADMGVAQCILTHARRVLKRSVEGLDGVILDKDLLETVTNAVEGIDADTVTAFATETF
jgi:hypothetical protein